MDGFLNSVGRFLTSKSVGKKTPTVRIYKARDFCHRRCKDPNQESKRLASSHSLACRETMMEHSMKGSK